MSELCHCADCRTFTEQAICTICANPRRLQERLENERIQEVILATNPPTVAGEAATANYIAEMCAHYGVMARRFAQAYR